MHSFLESIASSDKQLREVNGGYHELLMGQQFEPHARVIADWIVQRSANPPLPKL